LEEFDELYDPYSGITNNLSESYNAVMKQENDWKELPDDMLVLGFHFLQNVDSDYQGGNESALNDI
jgi:hypothetical protein